MIRGSVSPTDYEFSEISKSLNLVSWFRLANQQLQNQVASIRYDDLADNTKFPEMPPGGYGMLYTPWGVYSASDGDVWLRLHTGVTYSVGDSIPVTL